MFNAPDGRQADDSYMWTDLQSLQLCVENKSHLHLLQLICHELIADIKQASCIISCERYVMIEFK